MVWTVEPWRTDITSIVDWTANCQADIDVDRSSDRWSDPIRCLTPAVVRASIMEFGFPFFRRRQQRYALDGKAETDYCYGVLRRSEFTHITSVSGRRYDSLFFPPHAYAALIYLYRRLEINCCDRRKHVDGRRLRLQFLGTVCNMSVMSTEATRQVSQWG